MNANADERPDLAVATEANRVALFFADGAPGKFVRKGDLATEGAPNTAVANGDLNRDGEDDLAIATGEPGKISVVPNYREPSTVGVGGQPRSVAIGDLNADGRPDIADANGDSDNVQVLLAAGKEGGFTNRPVSKTSAALRSQLRSAT